MGSRSPGEFRVADIFDVIRPKFVRNDPVGDDFIIELGARNLSADNEFIDINRRISVRHTRLASLEEQRIRKGDILFVHRTNIGQVYYVNPEDEARLQKRLQATVIEKVSTAKLFASQDFYILRQRRRTSSHENWKHCDPRLLYMILMLPPVLKHWRSVVSGKKSPSIPIGEVERFDIPPQLVVKAVPSMDEWPEDPEDFPPHPDDYHADSISVREEIIRDFEARRIAIKEKNRLDIIMSDRLDDITGLFF